jgi:hypothetical protein
MMYERKK